MYTKKPFIDMLINDRFSLKKFRRSWELESKAREKCLQENLGKLKMTRMKKNFLNQLQKLLQIQLEEYINNSRPQP